MNLRRTRLGHGRLVILVAAATLLAASAGCGNGTAAAAPAQAAAPGRATAAVEPEVPHGYRAVDALGLEIITPVSLEVDPICPGRSVSRPTSGLTYGVGCVALEPPAVWIETARDTIDGANPPRSLDHCAAHPVLDGERGCLLIEAAPQDSDPWTTTVAIWPVHDVGVAALTTSADAALGRQIIATARWVPIDRNGCAPRRSPVVDATTGGLPDGTVLPVDTVRLSVCWYFGGRLAASAAVGSEGPDSADSAAIAAAIATLKHPITVGPAPGIGVPPHYTPDPRGPRCADLDATDGIVVIAHRSGGGSETSSAQFADCVGGHWWSNGVVKQPVDEALASALRPLTWFLLTFGYRAQGYVYPEVPADGRSTGSPVPTTPVSPVPTVPSSPAAMTSR